MKQTASIHLLSMISHHASCIPEICPAFFQIFDTLCTIAHIEYTYQPSMVVGISLFNCCLLSPQSFNNHPHQALPPLTINHQPSLFHHKPSINPYVADHQPTILTISFTNKFKHQSNHESSHINPKTLKHN